MMINSIFPNKKQLKMIFVSLLVVFSIPVGVVTADSASIKSISIVEKVDRDNDGRYSSFAVEIQADTSCVGCNDEGDDNIDANIDIVIIDEAGNEARHQGTAKFDVEETNDLTRTYQLDQYLDGYPPGETLTIKVELWDDDLIEHDFIDEQSVSITYEPPDEDTPTPTSTPTPTPTSTPSPTPTPTQTSSATSTNPPETSTSTAAEEGLQDSDGDGMIDSKDYAPQDPEVQEKSDVSTTLPGFGVGAALVAILLVGFYMIQKE